VSVNSEHDRPASGAGKATGNPVRPGWKSPGTKSILRPMQGPDRGGFRMPSATTYESLKKLGAFLAQNRQFRNKARPGGAHAVLISIGQVR
jgi:hypothetical protein